MRVWREHAPEYLAEGLGLGLFMISACCFGALLEHPSSPVHLAIRDATLRRALMGAAMGLTAIGIIHSPAGRRSGAHLNPAVTLAFHRLGRVPSADLAGYAAAQFVGAAAAVWIAARVLGGRLADPHVHFVVTRPGAHGLAAAFAGELLISFLMMSMVLRLSEHPKWMRWTGACAGLLVALWILIEAPLSGMSMNPARTFGSAVVAGDWSSWWIYFTAPTLGMLAAAELHRLAHRMRRQPMTGCAKLDHAADEPCIFCGQQARADLENSGNSHGTSVIEWAEPVAPTPAHHPSPKRGAPMQNRRIIIAVAAIAALIAGWAAFRPERLFINQTVHEDLSTAGGSDASAASLSTGPRVLARGAFHSGAHETVGEATVVELDGGRRVLELSGFHTSNGPDVQVYLVAADDAMDNATVTSAGFVPVAALKGNVGDQQYDLPAGVDLAKYRAVTIWCRRFGVNFGTAPLRMQNGSVGSMPSSEPQLLLSGMFHSGAHETQGRAAIVELGAGRRVLQLSDFHTSNGPDVQVYLVAASDAKDNATVTQAGFVRVADLKGNIGDQSYDLPADLDLAKYRAVTIWCRRFGVNFGTAPLTTRS